MGSSWSLKFAVSKKLFCELWAYYTIDNRLFACKISQISLMWPRFTGHSLSIAGGGNNKNRQSGSFCLASTHLDRLAEVLRMLLFVSFDVGIPSHQSSVFRESLETLTFSVWDAYQAWRNVHISVPFHWHFCICLTADIVHKRLEVISIMQRGSAAESNTSCECEFAVWSKDVLWSCMKNNTTGVVWFCNRHIQPALVLFSVSKTNQCKCPINEQITLMSHSF